MHEKDCPNSVSGEWGQGLPGQGREGVEGQRAAQITERSWMGTLWGLLDAVGVESIRMSLGFQARVTGGSRGGADFRAKSAFSFECGVIQSH